MKQRTRFVLLFLALAGTFVAGAWYGQRAGVTPANPRAHEPLHRVNSAHAAQADSGRISALLPPGAIEVSPERQQLIGVQVMAVEETSATHTLRVFGRVTADETRVYRVNAGVEGVIREASTVTTGSQVRKDQLLATFTAPHAASVIQLFIVNSGAAERVRKAPEGSADAQSAALAVANIRQRTEQLRALGMSDRQMEEISRTREYPESIRMLAPADGFVLARNVSAGQKFDKGAEFYRIADLKRVWIVADAFENEAHHLRPGAHAQVSLPGQRTMLSARVSEALPQFDGATRTLKVRLEADNPGYMLRPDMFVDVELPIARPPAIVVPVDALVDSGLRKTVFVERGAGFFEPRQVEVGWRFGEQVEIVRGLTPGERIAVSGAFFLESESRMKGAATMNGGRPNDEPGHPAASTADSAHAHGHGGHR